MWIIRSHWFHVSELLAKADASSLQTYGAKKSVRCNMAVDMATAGLITCINSLGKIMQALIRFYCLLLFWLVLTYHPSRDHSPYNNMCVCNVKTPRFWTSSVLCIAMGVFLQDNHAMYFSDTLHSFIVGHYSSIFRINPGLGYSLGLPVPKGFPKSAIQASFSI